MGHCGDRRGWSQGGQGETGQEPRYQRLGLPSATCDVGEMGTGGDAVSVTDSVRGDTDTPDGEIYTDNTGTDLTQFIISTLNKNAKDRVLMLKLEQEMSNLVRDAKKTHHKFPHMSSYHRDQDTQWQTEVFRSSIIRKLVQALSPTEINAVDLERKVFQRTDSKEEYLSFVARLILYVRQQADGQDAENVAFSQEEADSGGAG